MEIEFDGDRYKVKTEVIFKVVVDGEEIRSKTTFGGFEDIDAIRDTSLSSIKRAIARHKGLDINHPAIQEKVFK